MFKRYHGLVWVFVLACSGCAGCRQEEPEGVETNEWRSQEALSGADLVAFLEAHDGGQGHMERYEYGEAAREFRRALAIAPGSNAERVNLAIALLNDTGAKVEAEKTKAPGTAVSKGNFQEALEQLEAVLRRDRDNLHAHYCRGIILQYLGRMAEAHEEYQFVVKRDPSDAHAWLNLGATLTDASDPKARAGLEQADELIEIYEKALECNPYLVVALYRLQQAYVWAASNAREEARKARGEKGAGSEEAKAAARRAEELMAKRQEVYRRFEALDRRKSKTGSGDTGETFYGEMGKYAMVVDPFPESRARPREILSPLFGPVEALEVELPRGDRWVQSGDFGKSGDASEGLLGRARERFGLAMSVLDADGDGKYDLYLCAAVRTEGGIRDVLLVNRGDGRFEDGSEAFGLPREGWSLGASAGDFDADGFVDLFLSRVGRNVVLRNVGGARFEDVGEEALKGERAEEAVSLASRWLDLDQDGDLDLVVLNYAAMKDLEAVFTEEFPEGAANEVYRNDGVPPRVASTTPENDAPAAVAPEDREVTTGLSLVLTRMEGEEVEALIEAEGPTTGVVSLDLDDDRDLDLVFTYDGVAPKAAMNDRLGRFHAQTLEDLAPGDRSARKVNGAEVLDLDRDGRSDLVLVHPESRLRAWRNAPEMRKPGEVGPPGFSLEFWAIEAKLLRSAQRVDLDFDGWSDLLGVRSPDPERLWEPRWGRNEGNRIRSLSFSFYAPGQTPLLSMAWTDVAGDGRPDLVLVFDGQAPRIARGKDNGNHWLGLNLNGRWKFDFDFMRSNPHGLGTHVRCEGPGLEVPILHVPGGSALGQSCGPMYFGVGTSLSAALLHLRWPDGVMQAELNLPTDQMVELAEHNRKTGSCPVLFTDDGRRMVCIGDFLGGGGLGYLVAPGEYSQPDRDEAVMIRGDQLRARGGKLRLAVVEPMDELAYLDRLRLEVVDAPEGVETAVEERFAPGGNRPSGELLAWRRVVEPERAEDLKGRDVTEAVRAFDRRTVEGFGRLRGWIGYAEEHGLVLDFGERLSGFGPGDRLVLGLAGWVEYPYSQTNYAAATAGEALRAPVLERLREDGTWEVIEADPGYPAGLPRLTMLDLTGKLGGSRCVLRLRTNMECYWDQAFVARVEPELGVRVRTLEVEEARLGYRGYLREVSPDGKMPLLYDYQRIDPAPLARLEGEVTRYGDVRALLTEDDDRLCLVGPGDEVRLEFNAETLPELPEGWTRRYVLRAEGYCKDADPFTATSDRVGPLPWKGMGDYPFSEGGERPMDERYKAYLREYETREVGQGR